MDSELIAILRHGANESWRLNLSDEQLQQYATFADLIVDCNANRFNLTRLTLPPDMAIKHFLDSLSVINYVNIPFGSSLIDIGTGAGLPGIAIKIARPDIKVTLIDSTKKKITFCSEVISCLRLDGITAISARSEAISTEPAFAAQFDFAVARAVAQLSALLPWVAPFVKVGGVLVAMKGDNVADELSTAQPIARRLGLSQMTVRPYQLPNLLETIDRNLVICGKLRPR